MTGENRRTINKGDAPMYDGEQQIIDYYNCAFDVIPRTVNGVYAAQKCPYPRDSQRCFLTLWISGCRETEAVLLQPSQWKWNDEAIVGRKIPVYKKREKVKDADGNLVYRKVVLKVRQPDGSLKDELVYRPESVRKIVYREHVMPADIPLGDKFIDMIHEFQNEGFKYILFQRQKFSREIVPSRHTSGRTVLTRVSELHPDLFPHGIRALLTRYLKEKYKDKMDRNDVKELFMWSSAEMVDRYWGAQKIASAMGIKKLPT